jgi:hypothetical protein
MKPFEYIARSFGWFLLLFVGGCEEKIDLDLETGEPEIVIEGYVTTRKGPYTVSVTRSRPYFEPNNFPGVTGAEVVIRDDSGQVDTLVPADSSGIYKTTTLEGIPGRNYFLEVNVEGQTYTARTYLPDSVRIDSITYRYRKAEGFIEEGYYPILNGPEPDTAGNYYRAKVYKNDSLFDGRQDYFLSDDDLINGLLIRTELPFTFAPGDTARVELVNISENFYRFYESLIEQFQAGSPFAPPGNNVRSNIKGGALGYFGGRGVASETIVLPDTIPGNRSD